MQARSRPAALVDPLHTLLPTDLLTRFLGQIIRAGPGERRALVQLSLTCKAWRLRISQALRVELDSSLLSSAEINSKCDAVFRSIISSNPFLLDLPEGICSIALQPSPDWQNTDDAKRLTDTYCKDIVSRLKRLPPSRQASEIAVLAIASADMCESQRLFFLGQGCGDMLNDKSRHMTTAGAHKLGRILGEATTFSVSTFVNMLVVVRDLQERRDADARSRREQVALLCDKYNTHEQQLLIADRLVKVYGEDGWGAPDADRGNAAMALIASWAGTPAGNPHTWSVHPRYFDDGLALFHERCADEPHSDFEMVLRAIHWALPSSVNAENNQYVRKSSRGAKYAQHKAASKYAHFEYVGANGGSGIGDNSNNNAKDGLSEPFISSPASETEHAVLLQLLDEAADVLSFAVSPLSPQHAIAVPTDAEIVALEKAAEALGSLGEALLGYPLEMGDDHAKYL